MRAAFLRDGVRRDQVVGSEIVIETDWDHRHAERQLVERSVYRGQLAQEWFDGVVQARVRARG